MRWRYYRIFDGVGFRIFAQRGRLKMATVCAFRRPRSPRPALKSC
ncbi:hypothetical protein HMPREF3156_01641 [Neisseria sp. HMSC06F02]|nr:hypothetical protein HMPREF3156_01641 [Neisseria sp. HMSC06F02]